MSGCPAHLTFMHKYDIILAGNFALFIIKNKGDSLMDTAQNPLQFMEFSQTVSMEICRYLQSGNISDQQLQELIGKKDDIKNIAKEVAHKYLQLVPDQILVAKELIEKFYKEVFNFRVSLSKVVFPQQEGFGAYHYNTGRFNEDQIIKAYNKKWDVGVYTYQNLFRIDHKKDQARPEGPYPFAHVGGDSPDIAHLGKPYNYAIDEKINFANSVEYLLMTGFHKFVTDYFLDRSNFTQTSSLWLDGKSVLGYFFDNKNSIYLNFSLCNSALFKQGLREIIL